MVFVRKFSEFLNLRENLSISQILKLSTSQFMDNDRNYITNGSFKALQDVETLYRKTSFVSLQCERILKEQKGGGKK